MAADAVRPQARRRDAAATREALLAAARKLLASRGVEGTSTRDVSAAAGVNQALVYRYFGSKEKLFAEAAGGGLDARDTLVADTPLNDLPRALLGRALDAGGDTSGRLSDLVAAANDTMIRKVISEQIERGFGEQLAARLEGEDREVRAELLAAVIIGIAVLREKIGTKALVSADADLLADHVDRIAAVLLRPEPA
jgi:AcrR family transcriptional regulator